MSIQDVVREWIIAEQEHSFNRGRIPDIEDLTDLLMERDAIFPTIKMVFETANEPIVIYRFVEILEDWLKGYYADTFSEQWRSWITEQLKDYPDWVQGRWEYIDSRKPSLKARITRVRGVVEHYKSIDMPEELELRLRDLGVNEELISMLWHEWPDIADSDIFVPEGQ